VALITIGQNLFATSFQSKEGQAAHLPFAMLDDSFYVSDMANEDQEGGDHHFSIRIVLIDPA
jgi:hypothetical protein